MEPDDPARAGEQTADLGFARVDLGRAARTGDPETIYGEGKTAAQTLAIVRALRDHDPDRAVLITRASAEHADALVAELGADAVVHADARSVTVGPLPAPRGLVLVVSAGSSF